MGCGASSSKGIEAAQDAEAAPTAREEKREKRNGHVPKSKPLKESNGTKNGMITWWFYMKDRYPIGRILHVFLNGIVDWLMYSTSTVINCNF